MTPEREAWSILKRMARQAVALPTEGVPLGAAKALACCLAVPGWIAGLIATSALSPEDTQAGRAAMAALGGVGGLVALLTSLASFGLWIGAAAAAKAGDRDANASGCAAILWMAGGFAGAAALTFLQLLGAATAGAIGGR